jgi:hypothetical protein
MLIKILKTIFVFAIVASMSAFSSCQDKSRKELIIGKWRMEGEEYGKNQMALSFSKDNISILERLENGKSTLKQNYKYKLIDEEKYLLLEPLDTNNKVWKIGILELNTKILKLRSQSPDSSMLILKRLND